MGYNFNPSAVFSSFTHSGKFLYAGVSPDLPVKRESRGQCRDNEINSLPAFFLRKPTSGFQSIELIRELISLTKGGEKDYFGRAGAKGIT